MRRFSHFIAGVALAAFCISASAQFGGFDIGDVISNIAKASQGTDEAEEIRIGQEFAATLLGAKPLAPDARLQRYVNTLGRWLAMQTERPDLPWTFGVLDDAGYNAFATPGGYVFVTRGLVERMRSEAELAGVLAHEIGHVLKKHHLQAVQKNAGFSVVADLAGGAIRGGSEQARNFLMNFSRKLYASGLDKSDEFEADRLGVVIAARAGYDPYGLPSVLQVLQSQKADDANFSLLFKTHPAPGERIEMLDRLMTTQFDAIAANTGKPLAERLKEFSR